MDGGLKINEMKGVIKVEEEILWKEDKRTMQLAISYQTP